MEGKVGAGQKGGEEGSQKMLGGYPPIPMLGILKDLPVLSPPYPL